MGGSAAHPVRTGCRRAIAGSARGPVGRLTVSAVVASVSAVVVHHHRPDLLADCVQSLMAGSRAPDDIVIVDNEAAVGAAPPIAASARVRVLSRAENPGYAASCNTGAAATTGDYVLFLNGDVLVSPDCLERCMAAIGADPGVGVVTCQLRRLDGSLDHACHRGLPTPLASAAYKLRLDRLRPDSRRLGRYRLSWLDPATDHDVEACCGAFLLMSRALLEQIGGWDTRYWFYGEDLDLCVRVGRAGKRIHYLASARATHVKGASSYLGVPDRRLAPEQRRTKRQVRAAILDSHELFFKEHLATEASAPTRAAVGLMFALQRARLRVAGRTGAG